MSAPASPYPATVFAMDEAQVNMGHLTIADLRARWKEGRYRGMCPKYAKECIEWLQGKR